LLSVLVYFFINIIIWLEFTQYRWISFVFFTIKKYIILRNKKKECVSVKNKLLISMLAATLLLSSCGKVVNPPDVPDELNKAGESVVTPAEPEEDGNGSLSDENNNSDENSGNMQITESEEVKIVSENIDFPETYTVGTYNNETTAVVTLSDSGITFTGSNVEVNGSVVTVTDSGTYMFTGSLSDGGIIVNSTGSEKVSVVLNGVYISSSTTSPITVLQAADKAEIKVAKGSVNIVSDASTRSATDESNAAIYSKDDLDIESDGTLYVKGNFEKGIHSKDDLRLRESTVFIEAVDDGIRGKDSVRIESGNITVYCGADGIRTNNEVDEGKGFIEISGGKIKIDAGLDAIQAVTEVYISDGNITLKSGGGSINSSTKTDSGWGNWGGFGGRGGMGGFRGSQSSTSEETDSAKAIKATSSINISGGDFNIDSSDDSIHSNGTVNISGGTFVMNSGDDGIHADTDLMISDGTVSIEKSYEGIEGLDITISGGVINIVASDDGLNAAGGADQSSMNGRPGENGFGGRGGFGGFGGGMFGSGDGSITISGGQLTVNAAGDGIDANGKIIVEGGKTIVYGPTESMNGPIDFDVSCIVTGGTFVAMGSSGMAQDLSSGTTQARVFVRCSGTANSEIKITDPDGTVIFETVSPKLYGCILISTPEMVSGTEYTFSFNGEVAGSVAAK